MAQTSRFLIVMVLGVGSALHIACAPAPPANTNQPSVNANATPSNSSPIKSPQQSDNSTAGSIEVTSVPAGARVLLIATDDDTASEPQPKGVTPTTIAAIKPGKYTVHLERQGYRFFQRNVEVRAGKNLTINATLKKQ